MMGTVKMIYIQRS